MFHDEVFDEIKHTAENDPKISDRAAEFMHLFIKSNPNVFYFNGDDLDQEIIKTGADFYKEGFLDIPFDSVMYVISNAQVDNGPVESVGCVFMRHHFKPQNYFMFLTLRHQRSHFLFCADKKEIIDIFGDKGLDIGCICVEAQTDSKKFIDENYEGVASQIVDLIRVFFGGTMLLNTKYIEQDRVQISDKLNKKREKRGRPALQPYTLVTLKTLSRGEDGGGTHARPRPHWRRGHIRRYADGHITPIAPILVNADLGEAAQKVYKVKGDINARKITPSGNGGARQNSEAVESPDKENGPESRELCA